ncbi:Lrp/AsnC family transcriptional regulator [Azospirillum picis]|uniref:DNA-binding Lrp family transcriptional regulator n=1 Tax=Azospirillum picis TaxID=488438 RepID=A0ABU0MCL2_9PROT|nr:Lrp/AsnC family transcriptional regulator [Azospirillum picis]MBP2297806.1 DNA-binding Lrp family transcriptional regulator [Azospirillum picis]MDQ0531171.1 DNA-binding Lrp family transcriptional regulator [Azospirillum picis]
MHALDPLDHKILRLLRKDGRMSNAKLAAEVGLSPSACLRRLHMLEHSGVIRGYTAIIETDSEERAVTVIVQITLERQTDDYLRRFEAAVRRCPEVRECYLLSGSSDYLLRVVTQNSTDYDRIYMDSLSRLPGVVRIQSSFAIRSVVRPGVPPAMEEAG